MTEGRLLQLATNGEMVVLADKEVTTVAQARDELLVGTVAGIYGINIRTQARTAPVRETLPVAHVVRIVPSDRGLWVGTTRGVILLKQAESGDAGLSSTANPPGASLALPDGPHGIRYYASRRWLLDDEVVDLAIGRQGSVWALTRTGLNKIEFRPDDSREKRRTISIRRSDHATFASG